MQTQVATAKPNGHTAQRFCKCGCGDVVPAENRFSYINGHRGRAAHGKAHAPVKRAYKKRKTRVEIVDAPPQQQPDSPRVNLAVTEAQLNQFLVRLSLDDKQRLANYFLQIADTSSVA
jgi:hypothetical protein